MANITSIIYPRIQLHHYGFSDDLLQELARSLSLKTHLALPRVVQVTVATVGVDGNCYSNYILTNIIIFYGYLWGDELGL